MEKQETGMIPQRLEALRRQMEKRRIAVYIVPTADFHESEYVGAHFKARAFLTGFTGSAGTAVVTMTEAGLWTDGRYFVQAAAQLKGTGVTLYKMSEEGVPTVNEYVESVLEEGETIGFDGRVVNAGWGKELEEIAQRKHGALSDKEDLVGLIWDDRPALSAKPARILDVRYAGRSTGDKLADVRAAMAEKEADWHLLSSLYDIAWLLNVRGGDIRYVPVVLSYLAVSMDSCIWFVQEKAVCGEVLAYLEKNGIKVRPYESFYGFVETLTGKVLIDEEVVNYRIRKSIPAQAQVVADKNPEERMKAVKNGTELANTINAHVKDAAAMCKFMYWLKKNVGKEPMTELSVTDYLEKLRARQEGFLDLSFETICGYAEHGAIVHYAATPESDVPLKQEGLLLVDSGGHYLEGTTDITRTFALGPVTEEMRTNYTRVCRANLNLANVRFLRGCSGRNLDIIARQPLWEANLDYKHGTGHGVGYVLNVHEGPHSFRWKETPGRSEAYEIEPGMITSDEPGIYIEGQYGIRLENELLCREGEKNEYGQFLYFETITYVPFDLDAIDPEQMTEVERGRLNTYHAAVYDTVAPLLDDAERTWLAEATRAV